MSIDLVGESIGSASFQRDWHDTTWSIVQGCYRVSQGCDHCAAADVASRSKSLAEFAGVRNGLPAWFGVVRAKVERLGYVSHFRPGSLVFVGTTDLFHGDVPGWFQRAFVAAVRSRPDVRFGLLTKRSRAMRAFFRDEDKPPPENLLLGVTVELPQYLNRVDDLLAIQGAGVRFVSAEPLLGELSLEGRLGPGRLGWVVAGPELGSRRRPCDPAWMRRLRDEAAAARVPFFTKHILDGEEQRGLP